MPFSNDRHDTSCANSPKNEFFAQAGGVLGVEVQLQVQVQCKCKVLTLGGILGTAVLEIKLIRHVPLSDSDGNCQIGR